MLPAGAAAALALASAGGKDGFSHPTTPALAGVSPESATQIVRVALAIRLQAKIGAASYSIGYRRSIFAGMPEANQKIL
jgi:hypothetical protein